MTTTLRPLAAAYAPVLAGMHRICFAEPWNERAMADVLGMPGAFGILAMAEHPQGFILCRAAVDEAEVLTLLVLPPYRRQGLASRLLGAALEQAKAAGAAAMFLEVASNNDGGRQLYAAHRFQQVGCRRGYYGGQVDALVLKRDL